jgi:glycosyltransferase involved in cell wall biosynthesis
MNVNLVTSWQARCGIADYSCFLSDELGKQNVRVHIIPISRTLTVNPAYSFALGVKAGNSCDVVHVQFEYGLFANFAALLFYIGLFLRNSRTITTFHEIGGEFAGRIVRKLYARLLNRIICGVSDFVIVHNTYSAKKLFSTVRGMNRSKVKIIQHGCYEMPSFIDKEACKAKLNLSGKKILTIFGFVSKSKGHDLVVKIIPFLPEKIHLLIAGCPNDRKQETYYKDLRKMARELNSVNKITFVGYIADEDVPILLNATDLVLLPYRAVTQSGILNIAVAYRVPTIASDLEAFKEIKDQYGCIELFRTCDEKDLLAKILCLLNDEEKQDILKERCLKMWNETRWGRIATKHVEIYSEACTARRHAI